MPTPKTKKHPKLIPIIKIKDDFHYKPFQTKLPTRKVPAQVWDDYVELRSIAKDAQDKLDAFKKELNRYFK